jgi:Skp family chaperone for outer membrane proteins
MLRRFVPVMVLLICASLAHAQSAKELADLKSQVESLKAQMAEVKKAAESPKVALIDLNALAKALGRDQELSSLSEAARQNLVNQLQNLANDRRKQVTDEQARVDQAKTKLGDKPKADEEKQFQELIKEATTKVQKLQAEQNANFNEANTKYNQYRSQLVQKFRAEVQPFATAIARQRGMVLVMIPNQDMLLFEPAVDITPDVIVAMRGKVQPWISATTPTSSTAPAAPAPAPPLGAESKKSEPPKK